MNTTLDYLRSNRKFLVTDFMVYGDYSNAEGGLLYTELSLASNNTSVLWKLT